MRSLVLQNTILTQRSSRLRMSCSDCYVASCRSAILISSVEDDAERFETELKDCEDFAGHAAQCDPLVEEAGERNKEP